MSQHAGGSPPTQARTTHPPTPAAVPATEAVPTWSPWRAVVSFGLASLFADAVYEGARSVTGPLLASLGASALLVGVVTDAGEALDQVGAFAGRCGPRRASCRARSGCSPPRPGWPPRAWSPSG